MEEKVITDVREYPWVSNEAKVLRAEKELKKQGLPVIEEALKALYLRYGGLCVGQPETQLGVEEGQITLPVMTEEEKEAIVEKPTRKGRNAK